MHTLTNSHPDAEAFIARVLADPTDSVIRLVFADWLDELAGTANENWAKYIRLRTEASSRHGIDRDLLREEAANIAPELRARLTVPAASFAPHFVEFLDLLPPDRFTVELGDYLGPVPHVRAVGEPLSRRLRAVVIAERDNLFAVATDRPDPLVGRTLAPVLQGGVVQFPTWTPDLDAALDRHFPPPPRVRNPDETPVPAEPTLDDVPTKQACQRLIADARAEKAGGIEVVALPSGYEVRFLIGGRALRRHSIHRESGTRLVERFFELSHRMDTGVRALPRNTSFGDGVSVELVADPANAR